jgi:phospholipid transport system substrate-binding protein
MNYSLAVASALAGLALASVSHAGDAEPVTAETTPPPAAAASDEIEEAPASDTVDRLHEALGAVMRDAEALGYSGRYERLAPAVAELFDLDFMAEKSVGRHWKRATPEEQTQLRETFSRYTVANYAGRFTGWSGQEFKTHGEDDSARGTKLVRTTLLNPADEDTDLDYRLRKTDAGWRIIDIYFNGTVSELALRRSEYSSLIKREGFEALLAALNERISELHAAPAEGAS